MLESKLSRTSWTKEPRALAVVNYLLSLTLTLQPERASTETFTRFKRTLGMPPTAKVSRTSQQCSSSKPVQPLLTQLTSLTRQHAVLTSP